MNLLAVFKALADQTRLRLWCVLNYHELTVSEIVRIMEMGQSRISRHLKIMTEAGILTARRSGLRVFYTVAHTRNTNDLRRFMEDATGAEEPYVGDVTRAGAIMQERRFETSRFFDGVAAGWEQLRSELYGNTDVDAMLIEHVPSCRTAVDIGCGTGDLARLLAARADRVIGVDNSQGMLEHARSRFNGQDQAEFRLGDIEHLPLGDGEVDCAVMNMVLHHLQSPAAGLAEARRVLRDGGTLLVADLGPHQDQKLRARFGDRWMGFDADLLESWIREAGFTAVERESHELHGDVRMLLITAAASQPSRHAEPAINADRRLSGGR